MSSTTTIVTGTEQGFHSRWPIPNSRIRFPLMKRCLSASTAQYSPDASRRYKKCHRATVDASTSAGTRPTHLGKVGCWVWGWGRLTYRSGSLLQWVGDGVATISAPAMA